MFQARKIGYDVKIGRIVDDDRVWRVLKNGYPNKSISELGLETADDAYFATMQAINAILRGYTLEQAKSLYTPGQFAIDGESLDDIQRRGIKTLDVMYNLIDIGLNGKENRNQFLNVSIEKVTDFVKENDKYYSQTFAVKSSAEISEYEIQQLENLPNGTIVSDVNGKKKQQFKGGEKFKIMVPADNINKDIKGKITIKATQKNYPVYYGESAVAGFQDYALCNNSYSEVYADIDVYEQTNKSKLTILKVDSDTKQPIQGVKFQVTCTDGTVNTYTTNKEGKILISNQRPGYITVKEIETVGKYALNDTENKVKLGYNDTKEITIENELQKGNVEITKVDKDNNELKLSGVTFDIIDENGTVIREGTTDEKGKICFNNLVIGDYTVVEKSTKEGYVLSKDKTSVVVTSGKIAKLKLENERKKEEIKITKGNK